MILIGIITSAHGTRGAVKVRTFTQNPENLLSYGKLNDANDHPYNLKLVRIVNENSLIALVEGVNDRTRAEVLKGTKLYINRLQLPEPGEEEFYYTDLIGLNVENLEGVEIGKVQGVNNFGAGDFLEIVNKNGSTFSISFTQKAVPVISINNDKSKSYIQINPVFLLDSDISAPGKPGLDEQHLVEEADMNDSESGRKEK